MRKNYLGIVLCMFWIQACGPSGHQKAEESAAGLNSDYESQGVSAGVVKEEHGTSEEMTSLEKPRKETVSIPVPVSGTYLVARVLEGESEFKGFVTIGLALYRDGMRPDKELFQPSLDIETASRVKYELNSSELPGFDWVLTVSGPSLEFVQTTYSLIEMTYSLEDQQSKMTTKNRANLEAALGR